MTAADIDDDAEYDYQEARLNSAIASGEKILLTTHSNATTARTNAVIAKAVDEASNAVRVDPDSLFDQIATLRGTLAPYADGLGPDRMKAVMEGAAGGLALSSVEGFKAQKRFHDALAVLEGRTAHPVTGERMDYAGLIDPVDYDRALDGVQSGWEVQRGVDQKRYFAGFDSYVSAVSAGLQVDPALDAAYSDGEIDNMVDDPDQAQAMKNMVRLAIDARADVEELPTMSPADMAERRAAIEAQTRVEVRDDVEIDTALAAQTRLSNFDKQAAKVVQARA